jgi:two-component sensor histidine kinase
MDQSKLLTPCTTPSAAAPDTQPETWLGQVGRFLFRPHPGIQGDERRYRATTLSVLLLALTVLTAMGAFAEPDLTWPLLFAASLRLLIYLLSRSRYTTLAAYLIVGETLLSPFIMLTQMQAYDVEAVSRSLPWLILPVLLAGVALNPYSLAVTVALALGGQIASAMLIAELPMAYLAPTIGLTLNVAVFSLVTAILQRRYFAQRACVERQIRASLHEKEVLLKEIHHRVKNNLQVVSSLLSLQAGQTNDDAATGLLSDSQNRVKAMALIHESLYRSSDLGRINFAEYVHGLIRNLKPAYEPADHITFNIRADDVWLSLDSAVPCGLIINELVTNALKHAFPDDRRGTVDLSASAEGNQISLVIADDGVGIPDREHILDGETLGVQLVDSLVGQLEGTLAWSGKNGARYEIKFCDCPPETPDPDRPGGAAPGQTRERHEANAQP